MKYPLSAVLLLVGAIAGPAAKAAPANGHANPSVRAIVSYFESLSHRKYKNIVAGQFTGIDQAGHLVDLQMAFDKSGKWPALAGFDYVLSHRGGGIDWKTINGGAEEYWRQHGLVTISAHIDNPVRPEGGGLRDRPIDLQLLLTPGTDTYQRWLRELDTLADGLQDLKNHGVVVLWRPFHEMNGDWFWWGKSDPKLFHRVWQQMFERFTRQRKLDNLIWVFSANHGDQTAEYYPGDRYVDLVGLDAYTDDVDPQHIRGYEKMTRLRKTYGFTEYGPHGPENPPGDYDYRRFLEGLKRYFPRTRFFMCWNWKWGLGWNNHSRELMADPLIVTREDLPRRLFPRMRNHSK